MASIDYNNYPFLKVPTFINCNSKIEYPFNEFEELYKKGKVKYISDISNEEYDLIIKGILLSEDIEEEVKGLFK